MRKIDYHMHTHFSADSEEDPRNHILEAIAHGLDEICFTDHRDFHYPGMPFELDLPAYFSEIQALKQEFAPQIIIKQGLEIGLDMNYRQEIQDFVKQSPFDFVIGSVHVIDNQEFYETTDFFEDKTKSEAYKTYFDAILDCVKNFDCFNSLGHMDYIVRYATFADNFVNFDEFSQIISEILRTLVKKNKGLEVNTRLFDRPQTIEFYRLLLTKYSDFGGKIVTLGTDSHSAERNWASFKSARELIQSVGFNEIATFTNQKIDEIGG